MQETPSSIPHPPTSVKCEARIVEIGLTPGQETLLAPLVRSAAAARRNVLFLATAAPGNGTWRLQVMNISAGTGAKLLQLLRKEGTS